MILLYISWQASVSLKTSHLKALAVHLRFLLKSEVRIGFCPFLPSTICFKRVENCVGKLTGNPLYTIVYARRYKTLTCPVHLHTLLSKKCKIARLYSSHKYYRVGLYERQNTRNGDPAPFSMRHSRVQ